LFDLNIKNDNKFDVFKFIFKEILKLNKLEFHLLKNLSNTKRLIIMFDVFDEVLDYKETVIEIIEID
jgi:hypothetical protein